MIQTKLKGMGVALITPFKEDESVDYDALMRMVDYLLQNNADFLCVLGTTAETPTLTEEEKKTIKKMVIDRVNGRIPILLGVGGNNTRAIVETLKNDDFTGVDAILSVVPYYNKPSQEGIYQHYKAIAEATEESHKISTLRANGLLDADACAVRMNAISAKLALLTKSRTNSRGML